MQTLLSVMAQDPDPMKPALSPIQEREERIPRMMVKGDPRTTVMKLV